MAQMKVEVFKIAICDDNQKICGELERIITAFLKKREIISEVEVFYSGEELICYLNDGERYDLVYLDIEFPSINGVEVGVLIREELHDETVHIAYISGNKEYAMELFQVRPIDFLVKPLQKTEIIKTLQKAIELTLKKDEAFYFKIGKSIKKVHAKEILYFSSSLKKIAIHMNQGIEVFYGKISELSMPTNDFVQVHKSYIVNWNYVKSLKYDMLEMMNGEKITISRHYRSQIHEKIKELDEVI